MSPPAFTFVLIFILVILLFGLWFCGDGRRSFAQARRIWSLDLAFARRCESRFFSLTPTWRKSRAKTINAAKKNLWTNNGGSDGGRGDGEETPHEFTCYPVAAAPVVPRWAIIRRANIHNFPDGRSETDGRFIERSDA